MGLPGAGKTTIANELSKKFNTLSMNTLFFNADYVRERFDDWDFSIEGRIRQAKRMRELADTADSNPRFVIADFVCPLPEMREIYNADYTIWIDTIQAGRFEDTNQMFVPPEKYNIRVTEQDTPKWILIILEDLFYELRD
jgi:adenylylsulfate kinase